MCDTLICDTLMCNTLICDTLMCDTLMCDTLMCDTLMCNTLLYDSILYDTLMCDTLTGVTLDALLLLIKQLSRALLAGYAVSVAVGIFRYRKYCNQARKLLSVMLVWSQKPQHLTYFHLSLAYPLVYEMEKRKSICPR
jgi:hypothetical protein